MTQLSVTAAEPVLDETAVNLDQIHRAHAPQSFEYKAPANIKEVSATLHSSPSALASDTEQDSSMLTSVQGFQQQQGHKTQRASVISDVSFVSAEDEFAEVPHELQVQQQRLLKMPPKLREQPRLIQSRTSLVESDDQTQSTIVSRRRKMVAALQEEDEKKEEAEEDKEEKEKSISPELSMNVDEVIETLRLEDELLEPQKPFVADIPAVTEEDKPISTPTVVDILPPIEELPQTITEEISVQLHQLDSVPSDQHVEEILPLPQTDVEVQSLLNQLDQVSSIQPAPLDLPTTEEMLSSATIEKEPATPVAQKTEEAFEILTSKIVDYIEIPPSKTDSDEQKPEAIIITDEVKSTESVSRVEGMFC